MKEVTAEPYIRPRFDCPVCSKNVRDLNRHLRQVHDIGPYRVTFPSVVISRRRRIVSEASINTDLNVDLNTSSTAETNLLIF